MSYPDKNKELIFDFENMLYAEGISNARVFRYGEKLKFGGSSQKPLLPPIGWIAPKDSLSSIEIKPVKLLWRCIISVAHLSSG